MIRFLNIITADLHEKSNQKKSLNRRKTLVMPENTEVFGSVVADWLQNVLSICYQNDLNMYLRNAAEESAAFWEKVIDMWV